MSKTNKFTKQLDSKLKKLKQKEEYLTNLNKGVFKTRRTKGKGLKIDPESAFYSNIIKSTSEDITKLKSEIDSLYSIVSGKQDIIKFSRVSNHPLNRLGIGPQSNKTVFNRFALNDAELQKRYPELYKGGNKVEQNTNPYNLPKDAQFDFSKAVTSRDIRISKDNKPIKNSLAIG